VHEHEAIAISRQAGTTPFNSRWVGIQGKHATIWADTIEQSHGVPTASQGAVNKAITWLRVQTCQNGLQ
jgi:hypothetical protein